MNRIDKSVVFERFAPSTCSRSWKSNWHGTAALLMASAVTIRIQLHCESEKSFCWHEGTDPKYGARHLKRAIERHIVFQLANLVATGQIKLRRLYPHRLESEAAHVHQGSRERHGSMLLERHGAAAGALPMARQPGLVARREFGATGTLDGK